MRFIPYTSISHFGFIVLSIFAFTSQSPTGSTLYMLNHGMSTAALFVIAGFLIKRRGSRGYQRVRRRGPGGPSAGGVAVVRRTLHAVAVGAVSFVSEFMVLAGTFAGTRVRGDLYACDCVGGALPS